MIGSSDDPLTDACNVVQRTYELLVAARMTRERLVPMAPTDAATEGERAVYLEMLAVLQRDLVGALEHVLRELKGAALSAEAEAWWRRTLDGMGA